MITKVDCCSVAQTFDLKQGFVLLYDRHTRTISLFTLSGERLYFNFGGCDNKMLFYCIRTKNDFFKLISLITELLDLRFKDCDVSEEKEDWKCIFLPKTNLSKNKK